MKKRMNAGYEIIKEERYSDKYEIVLGKCINCDLWVTWESKVDCDDYFWGHYFNSRIHAIIDYHRRLLERYNEIPF